jgi:hypothetical protein
LEKAREAARKRRAADPERYREYGRKWRAAKPQANKNKRATREESLTKRAAAQLRKDKVNKRRAAAQQRARAPDQSLTEPA